jgi:regulator of sigma E protease
MIDLLAFLVTIAVLVTFHEFGHYCVAKLCGVKVVRFSLGFGKPFCTWRMFDTEWALSPIPLGGYVRMLDEREGLVLPEERHRSFTAQSVGRRMAIVAAGPLANLALAVLLYWIVAAQGVTQLKPWVGTVVPDSPAAVSGFVPGDRIETIDGLSVANWQDVHAALLGSAGNPDRPVDIVVRQGGVRVVRRVDLPEFAAAFASQLEEGNIGILPERPMPVIGRIQAGGAAMQAGLMPGDRLVSVDGRSVSTWTEWTRVIRDNPGKLLEITVIRQGQTRVIGVRPALLEQPAGFVGYIGAGAQMDSTWFSTLQYVERFDVQSAGREALHRTLDTSWMTLKLMGRMLDGSVSVSNLSGPLGIADAAGETAREGIISYLEFLALISISIGVLNLLPIPVLDGGHLMYYTAELVRGKPLSERVQMLGQRIGFGILAALMAFAVLNDISRLFGG